jgi:gamma-glutamylcyclotransferase (GGCT)/AIG2-like uncharacterized protein YtfP
MPQLFVYGTLMRSCANNVVLRELGGRFLDVVATASPRTLVDLGPYPALLPATHPAALPVSGELWDIDADGFDALDAFEGCPDLFRRETVSVVRNREVVFAFVYVFAQPIPAEAQILSSGVYLSRGARLPSGARRP